MKKNHFLVGRWKIKKGHENQKNLLEAGQRLVLLQRAGDGLRARRTDLVVAEAKNEPINKWLATNRQEKSHFLAAGK